MNNLLMLLPVVLAPALTVGGCGSSKTSPDSPSAKSVPNIVGGWASPCTPMSTTQGFMLDFDIAAKTWAVDYVVFGDTTCTAKFLTVHIEGPYEIDAVTTAEGASHARFGFTKKTVTPHSAAAAGFLSSDAGCKLAGFSDGTPKDISTTGCAALGQYPIDTCPADFDLVKVEADSIRFGERPKDNNMCTEAKRPTTLAALSSKRK